MDVYKRLLGSDRFQEAFIRSVVPVCYVLLLGLVGLGQLGKMNWSGGVKNGDR